MVDISVQGIVKAFEEDNDILKGLSFEINAGEHVGLLGKNGAGKTTLFRILAGEIGYDEGNIVVPQGKRMGLISQIPKYPPEYTVEDVLKDAHKRLYNLKDRMDELAGKMERDPSPELLAEYDRCHAAFESGGGYNMDTDRNRVANGLEIPEAQRSQLFSSLSGGEKTRANLSRLILEDTDILLLDEPTNHLDMRATEWLEDYLLKFRGTVLTISHDRYFLDRVVSRTIEIVDGKAEFYSGNYSFYLEEKQRRFEEKMAQYEKNRAKIDQLEKAADQMHLWAFMGNDKLHKRAFSMEKRIERLKTDKPTVERKMKARFGETKFRGDEVLVIDGVTKSFDGRTLFRDVTLSVTGGERIALIGDNGTGKSTFIKLIMGEETADRGYIRIGPAVKPAYLPQIIKFKNPYRSVLDMMIWEENCTPQEARNRLGAFKFSGEDVFRPVSDLSGGEQSRLRLCILMRDNINLLILDEPTNHLDAASRDWIEDAVEEYQEALLFVSHDRYFISKFATRIWEIRDGEIHDYKCGFEEYKKRREDAAQRELIVKHREQKLERQDKPKAEKPKNRAKNPAQTEKQLAKLEKEIAAAEAELNALNQQVEEFASDYSKLCQLEEEIGRRKEALEEMYARWEELAR